MGRLNRVEFVANLANELKSAGGRGLGRCNDEARPLRGVWGSSHASGHFAA